MYKDNLVLNSLKEELMNRKKQIKGFDHEVH